MLPHNVPVRLVQQLQFILEIDRLKTVLRQTVLADRSRNENTAEHSWHLAMMVQILAEYFPIEFNVAHATRLLLVHDLVEIEADDTFAYDDAGNATKAEREQQAALLIYGKLPADQREEYIGLWHEFEAGETPEAQVALAIDRLQPFLLNFFTDGASWRKHSVRTSQVRRRMGAVGSSAPALGGLIESLISQSVERGLLILDDAK